jgi:hypothetical protein
MPSLRAEQDRLREQMRAAGLGTEIIAAEFACRYGLRPRAAWRHAHGWPLTRAAGRISTEDAAAGLHPDGPGCRHDRRPPVRVRRLAGDRRQGDRAQAHALCPGTAGAYLRRGHSRSPGHPGLPEPVASRPADHRGMQPGRLPAFPRHRHQSPPRASLPAAAAGKAARIDRP